MSVLTACLIGLILVGLVPSLALASHGSSPDRLIGVQNGSSILVFCTILLSQIPPGQSYELVVPLVLAPLSFVGVLVFTRLLAPLEDA